MAYKTLEARIIRPHGVQDHEANAFRIAEKEGYSILEFLWFDEASKEAVVLGSIRVSEMFLATLGQLIWQGGPTPTVLH